jgi:uracil-DNA glycosylase family 4
MNDVTLTTPVCEACPLAGGRRVVPPLRPAEILVVGEAPGAEEEEKGVSFVGPAGKLLRSALEGTDVVYTNTVQCRPPDNRTPTKEEIKACAPSVQHSIDVVHPRIVLAVGATALKALTGRTGILKHAGKLIIREDGVTVMGVLHPSWVLHGGDVRRFDDCIKSLRAWLTPAKVKYLTLTTGKQLNAVQFKDVPLGFDWETSDLNPTEGGILSFAVSDGDTNVVLYGEPDEDAWEFLRTHRLIAHSATFEHQWAKAFGRNIFVTDDTQILSHLEDERASTKLESVAVRLGVPIITYPDSNVAAYDARRLAERNTIHAQATAQIFQLLYPKLGRARTLYRTVLCPATETIAELHINGLAFSESRRVAALKKIEEDQTDPTTIIRKASGSEYFNIKSAPQRVKLLYDTLRLPKVFETKGGGWSTDAEVMRYFQMKYKDDRRRGPVLKALIDLTTMYGWKTQFLEAFPSYSDEEHVLHGRYHITGTVTGRLSTSSPNMQNMPRSGPVRSCLVSRFGPRKGRLWTADYKQIELMIFAAVSGDERLIHAFATGEDIHRLTASIVLHKPGEEITDEERFLGKRLNFAMATGVGAAKLAFMIGSTEDEARTYITRFFEGYQQLGSHVQRYRHHVPAEIISPTGRVRHLDPSDIIRSRNQALNFIPQEIALTTHLIAANGISAFLRNSNHKAVLVALIHDSITLDVPINEEDAVIPEFYRWLDAPNDDPLLATIREAGITFRFDMKAGYSLGEQEEVV